MNKYSNPNDHIELKDLLAFGAKQLTPEMINQVEAHSKNCQMCADALKGIKTFKHLDQFQALHQSLLKRKAIRKSRFSPKFIGFSHLLILILVFLILLAGTLVVVLAID
jgi:hypothetical protein